MKALYRGLDGRCTLRNGQLYEIELANAHHAKAAMVICVRADAGSRFLMSYETLRAFCAEWHLMEAVVAACVYQSTRHLDT